MKKMKPYRFSFWPVHRCNSRKGHQKIHIWFVGYRTQKRNQHKTNARSRGERDEQGSTIAGASSGYSSYCRRALRLPDSALVSRHCTNPRRCNNENKIQLPPLIKYLTPTIPLSLKSVNRFLDCLRLFLMFGIHGVQVFGFDDLG